MSSIIRLKPKPKPNLQIGVVIQARMTSKRFPGKSMAILLNKPVIQWTIERAKRIEPVKKSDLTVVLAVPDTDESEPMLELADKLNIANFCGNEDDVLKRYYDCARFFGFDIIIRITGDCPFIDPRVCAEVLYLLIWRKLDYSSNCYPIRTYPKGLDCEVFTLDCLEAAHKLSTTPYDREHVTPWMQRTVDIRRGQIKQKIDVSNLNWCVDCPEDIQRLEKEASIKSVILMEDNENVKPTN